MTEPIHKGKLIVSKLFTYMYNNKLIDELHLFHSSKKIGKLGIPMYLSQNKLSLNKLKHLLVEKKSFDNKRSRLSCQIKLTKKLDGLLVHLLDDELL